LVRWAQLLKGEPERFFDHRRTQCIVLAYSQCLQLPIECIEALLDDGLGIAEPVSVEFDLDALLRMDSATLIDVQAKGVGSGIVSPNEARRKLGLPPVKGGDSPYLQQQNYSLDALDARDRLNPAPSSSSGAAPQQMHFRRLSQSEILALRAEFDAERSAAQQRRAAGLPEPPEPQP
jgi:phage portal protein BeeE